MRSTRHRLDPAVRQQSVALLSDLLPSVLDLERHAKQAHWNVRGEQFAALHRLFDEVAEHAVAHGDLLAERIVALGGVADGRIERIGSATRLGGYPVVVQTGPAHLAALATSIATVAEAARVAIDVAAQRGDSVSADVLTEVARDLDKLLWQVEASQPVAA